MGTYQDVLDQHPETSVPLTGRFSLTVEIPGRHQQKYDMQFLIPANQDFERMAAAEALHKLIDRVDVALGLVYR